MARECAGLRAQLESALASRFPSPFAFRPRDVTETVSVGIPEIDSLAGGLPRGGLTEIFGPPCSGRTSLLHSVLAALTAQDEFCAWVDARDSWDPHSAKAAGVELKQVLWVRCGNIEQALRATDLVLQGGGFGLLALDLGDLAPQAVRRVPLHVWFRLRRVVENTPTVLVLLEQEPCAKNCASLVLRVRRETAYWSGDAALQHAHLLRGTEIRAELLHRRFERAAMAPTSFKRFSTGASLLGTAEILFVDRDQSDRARQINPSASGPLR